MLTTSISETGQTTLQDDSLESSFSSNCLGMAGFPSHHNILHQVGQTILLTPPNIWAALDLDQYFGFDSKTLAFKEMLVPFVWVARQELIDRVGEDYISLPGSTRQKIEAELFASLDALCLQKIQGSYPQATTTELFAIAEAHRKQGWQEFCREHPWIAAELAEKLVHWINTVAGFLSLVG
ncbi:MAG TPA: hypothetical protein V6D07_01470 [Trichocoleus sp.]